MTSLLRLTDSRRTRWLLALPLLMALLSTRGRAQDLTPSAVAQPSTDAPEQSEPTGYDAAVETGLNEYDVGNYEEARAHFLRAHELYPNARTLRGLGKVEFELRNYGDAAQLLQQAMVSTVRPLDAELRDETEKLLARARVYVGEVHVDVEPGSATVSVDGVTMASGPRASLSLLVGDHILEFRANGRMSERRSVRVTGGEKTVIQVVLAPPPDYARAHPGDPKDDATPLRKKWWLWTGVALVAGAAVVGLSVGLSDKDSASEPVSGGTSGAVLVNP